MAGQQFQHRHGERI